MSERFAHLATVEDDQPTNIAESFERIDLAAVLAGDLKQPEPTLLYRHGDDIRSALIYEAMVNGVHGDSGTGKSWIAVAVMKERFDAGDNVMLFDLEDRYAAEQKEDDAGNQQFQGVCDQDLNALD